MMEPVPQPDHTTPPGQTVSTDLAAALGRLWTRFLPEICNRVAIIQTAAAACAAGKLSTAQREAANAASHKLAGTLGTFNLMRGTDLAREFEILSSRDDTSDPTLAGRLVAIAAELHSIVDNRK
jgi:Hpt domain